jgi:surface polysaccharide O-acyltransferase-like enzyme
MALDKAVLEEKTQQKQVNLTFSADFIRTVAIFLIILVHVASFPYYINELTFSETFNWFTVDVYGAIAQTGVPLFVMLTGVLLLDPAKVDEPLKVFFKKRFARIGLPWIFWTIAYFVWSYYVRGTELSQGNILTGLIEGSYDHLWFLYLLFGLYLATPILRILVKNIDHQRFKYLIILWIAGSFTVPFVHSFLGLSFNPVMFVFIDWVGYYLLGVYLLQSKVSKRWVYAGLIGGLAATSISDAVIPILAGAKTIGFFHDYVVFTVIITSASLFLVLTSIPKNLFENNNLANRGLHWIGQNTLPIYLIHYMILDIVRSGWLGFSINNQILPPIIGAPLFTIITLGLSILIAYPLKKIPYVCKIIG